MDCSNLDQHIYEDPDAMGMSTVCANTLVPKDYRENFTVSSGSRSRVPRQQQLSNEQKNNPQKSPKKWNIKLRVRKNKHSEDGDKTRREKQVIGESAGRKGFKKTKPDKRGQSLSENSGQSLKKGRSRGQDLSPALLGALETMTVETQVDEHLYDKDSPPPALPSRGYLLDEGFAAELNEIERQTAETDSESDEVSDGYTSMTSYHNVAGTEHHTWTNQDVVTSSEQGYESHTSLIPEGCYENFTDTKRRPIRDVNTVSSEQQEDESHTPLIPERRLYKNFSDTQKCVTHTTVTLSEEKCESYSPLLPERHYDNFADTESSPASTIAQKDIPPIPKRPYKNDIRGSLTHTMLETECESHLPPLPERHYDNFVDTKAPPKQETAPPIPKRPYKNETRESITHTMSDTDRNLPPVLVLERHYKNFTDTKRHPTVQEDESHTPPIPDRCYENIFDTKGYPTRDAATGSREEESESYVPLIPGRHYDNGPDEDVYINQDDAPDTSRVKRGPGSYMTSKKGNQWGSGIESDELEYDYVRRTAGWCRATKSGRK